MEGVNKRIESVIAEKAALIELKNADSADLKEAHDKVVAEIKAKFVDMDQELKDILAETAESDKAHAEALAHKNTVLNGVKGQIESVILSIKTEVDAAAELDEKIAALKATGTKLTTKLNNEVNDTAIIAAQFEADFNELQATFDARADDINSQIEQVNEAKTVKEAEYEKLTEVLANQKAESVQALIDLTDKLNGINLQIEALKTEKSTLTVEIGDLNTKIETGQTDLEAAQNAFKDQEEDYNTTITSMNDKYLSEITNMKSVLEGKIADNV